MTLFGAQTSAVRDRKRKQLPPPESRDQDAEDLGMPAPAPWENVHGGSPTRSLTLCPPPTLWSHLFLSLSQRRTFPHVVKWSIICRADDAATMLPRVCVPV